MSATPEPRPAPLVPLPARLAVLLSGRGSNFLALADACDEGRIPATVAVVISDKPGAAGLARARERGLPVLELSRAAFPSRDAYEEALAAGLQDHGADLICLAGFMRILSAGLVDRFPLRILNVHPSLLPAFPGLEAQAQALRYGVRVTGATVHFVDAGMDSGPIVLQEAVPVLADDDEAALSARILAVEHRLYPEAVRRVLAGGWRVDGRRVVGLSRP